MKPLLFPSQRRARAGFSLVEVILALGAVVLILLPVLGLLGVGLTSVHETEMQMEAANVASTILNKRLSVPGLASASPLPTIDSNSLAATTFPTEPPTSATLVKYIDSGGDDVSSNPKAAKFSLKYRVWLDQQTLTTSSTHVVRIDLLLTWPVNATVDSRNQYELVTSTLVQP